MSKSALKGILCTIVGSALLTLNDAILKWLTTDIPVGQATAIRGSVILLIVAMLVAWQGSWQRLRIFNIRGQCGRGLLVVCSTFCFVSSLSLMPLADAIAIAFAGPLFLTFLAASVLGEQVSKQRWIAVSLGFIGILIILRPGEQGFNWAALLPLSAGFLGAARDSLTRHMRLTESTLATMTVTTLFVVLAGLCTIPLGWQILSWQELGLLIVAGLLIGSAHFLLIESFRWAEASLLAPFKYSSYLWAILLGLLIWGQVPELWVIIGAGLVIASSLYILA